MPWLLISFFISSVCIDEIPAGKVVKIVNEPANYGGLQSYQSNHPKPKLILKPHRKAEQISGPYHLRRLAGKCFSLTDNSYKYELCPFYNITQHEQTWRWNAFEGILGVWKEWSIVNNTFEAMVMNDGDECPGNTRRKSKVFLKCGKSNVLVSVKEPSTCAYEVVFKTPLACPIDVFLVYPMLSTEDQKEWEDIEKSLFHEEITPQGYKKRRKKLFVRAGLQLAVKTKTESKKEIVTKNEKINHAFVPKKVFQTKQDCAQAYSELLHEFLVLRELMVKHNSSATAATNTTNQISDVQLATNAGIRARGDMGIINNNGQTNI